MKRDTATAPVPLATIPAPTEITPSAVELSVLSASQFAHRIIQKQFRYIVAQQDGVITDQDPEYLHQMRVGLRLFQAAVTVFAPLLDNTIDFRYGKRVLKSLGRLRDFDLQLEYINTKRQQAPTPGVQKSLMYLHRDLAQQRRGVYQQVRKALTQKSDYRNFKQQTKKWLKKPRYQPIAELPIQSCAPELLSPIVSRLLLHPA